jgi:DNA-binding transcriptional LysR family regulator
MNLNLLRIFHAVAGALSFTRASQELHLTQPGISKHIRELEEQYGTRLFDRLGKRIALTQAGEILFRTTGDLFRLIDESRRRIDDLNGLTGGKLDIGASMTIGTHLLPGTLVRFGQQYPDIKIKVITAFGRQVVDLVLNNTLEMGFIGHCAADARLVVRPFMTDRMALIVSPRHPWTTRRSPVNPRELADQPFLLSNRGSGTWRVVEKMLSGRGISLANTLELGTTEAVKQAVAADLGVSIVSRHVLPRELASGLITTVPLVGGEPVRDLYVVCHKDRYLSAAGRAFLGLMGVSPLNPVATARP